MMLGAVFKKIPIRGALYYKCPYGNHSFGFLYRTRAQVTHKDAVTVKTGK